MEQAGLERIGLSCQSDGEIDAASKSLVRFDRYQQSM